MKATPGLLCAVLFTVLLSWQNARALDQETIESTVKIVCPVPAKDGRGGIAFDSLPVLADGQILNVYDWGGAGTGFVINDEGYVVSNNHVVGLHLRDANGKVTGYAETPNPFVIVVQKKGAHYFVHKATVVWQSNNLDVAIMRCPTLKAKPLPISFQTPHESDHVSSCGFPGISDVASEDRDTQRKVTIKLIELIAAKRLKKEEEKKGSPLTEEEQDAVYKAVAKIVEPVEIEWNLFLNGINPGLQGWNPEKGPLDISSVVNSKDVWKSFLTATVTEGNIQKVMAAQGFSNDAKLASIAVIQHNLAIHHGNSGGPLLDADANVIGVVGRAFLERSSGESEQQTLATRITETEKWLKDNHVAFSGPPWRLPRNFVVIAAVSLAIFLALAACVLALLRRRAASTTGYTTMIDDKVRRQLDAMMAREHPHTGTPPPRQAAVPPFPGTRPPAIPNTPAWILGGRDSQGRTIKLELSEALLASRSDGILIGRSSGQSQLVVNHDSISKQHAQLRKAGTAFLVSDRQSANGTAVNGRFGKPFEEMPLRVGDTLTLGEVKLQFTEA